MKIRSQIGDVQNRAGWEVYGGTAVGNPLIDGGEISVPRLIGWIGTCIVHIPKGHLKCARESFRALSPIVIKRDAIINVCRDRKQKVKV